MAAPQSQGGLMVSIERLRHPLQRYLAIRFANQAVHLDPVGLAINPERYPALMGCIGRGKEAAIAEELLLPPPARHTSPSTCRGALPQPFQRRLRFRRGRPVGVAFSKSFQEF